MYSQRHYVTVWCVILYSDLVQFEEMFSSRCMRELQNARKTRSSLFRNKVIKIYSVKRIAIYALYKYNTI